ncbi:MAG: MTH1187 family thiamine-binding protein [Candidatus Thermoplasmatota archaeon]|nr:MTH1187 family thiamine-binding protein [Candidatus Thermoplasmatota archaeon]
MILVEVTYYPIGEGTSAARYVKEAVRALKETGLKVIPGSMSSVLEGNSLDELFEAIKKGEEKIISMGIKRVETIIKIDHRLDSENSAEKKLREIS